MAPEIDVDIVKGTLTVRGAVLTQVPSKGAMAWIEKGCGALPSNECVTRAGREG